MNIAQLRGDLEELRTQVNDGHADKALATIEHALQLLDGGHLLTTTEAARALGIRSVNTLKLLVRAEGMRTVSHGNRMMIPLSEVERIQQSERVRGLRASDRMHDATEELGGDSGLSAAELEDLEAARPGAPLWRTDEAEQQPTAGNSR